MIKNNLLSIRLILGNILDNTVKYCAQGSTIKIELNPTTESVILCVKNNINSDQDGLKSVGDGYGVGLSVCEKLSEWLDMDFIAKEKSDCFCCKLTVNLSE